MGPRRYRYHELAAATSNFAEEEKLGRGGFGNVYRGSLGDQDRAVAIKMFSAAESSAQGRKEFEAEVKIISRLRHRNLVRLLGWCDSRKGLLLVYELVPEGSLDRHLYLQLQQLAILAREVLQSLKTKKIHSLLLRLSSTSSYLEGYYPLIASVLTSTC